MDSLEDFEPQDTTGFVAIQTIRYSPIASGRLTSHMANISQAQEVWSAEGGRGRESEPGITADSTT